MSRTYTLRCGESSDQTGWAFLGLRTQTRRARKMALRNQGIVLHARTTFHRFSHKEVNNMRRITHPINVQWNSQREGLGSQAYFSFRVTFPRATKQIRRIKEKELVVRPLSWRLRTNTKGIQCQKRQDTHGHKLRRNMQGLIRLITSASFMSSRSARENDGKRCVATKTDSCQSGSRPLGRRILLLLDGSSHQIWGENLSL